MSIDGRPAASNEVVPLHDSRRVKPIHPSVQEVKLPTPSDAERAVQDAQTQAAEGVEKDRPISPSSASQLNPLTLQPFTMEELRSHNLEGLVNQYSTPEAAQKARDDAAKELRRVIDDYDRRTKDIKAQMEEKEKTREIERKVFARKSGKDG